MADLSGLGGFKSLLGTNNWGSSAGNIISGIGSAIGNKYDDGFTDSQMSVQSGLRNLIAMIPGVGQIAAAVTGGLDAIGSVTGINLSNINKNSAKKAGLGFSAGFNNTINYLPGLSALAGGFGLWSDRTDGFGISDETQSVENGYRSTLSNLRSAQDLANKRLVFGKKKANAFLDTASNNEQILHNIAETNTVRKQNDYFKDLNHQNINRYAGQNYLGVSVGKEGLKLMSLEEARKIIALRHQPNKFKNGGVIGIDTNVFPEGALHARKNNLSELNPDLEDATKKGIPVMAAEGGEIGEQVAEIEHSEIIFRLEVTKKLEELRKDGSEQAMLKAGKLIAEELIENTQDNVGVINGE